MKIVCVNGSPHGNSGTTGLVTKYLLQGAEKAGARTETILLSDIAVKPCLGCDECSKTGHCTINDDCSAVQQSMEVADAIILACPNYVSNVSAQMKALIDRCQTMIHCQTIKGKYGAAVVTSGGPFTDRALEYLDFFMEMLGCWKVDGLFVTNPQLTDPDQREKIFKEANDLGKKLVQSAAKKSTFPDQIAALNEKFEIMKMLVMFQKDRWPYKYNHWQSHWGLQED